MKSETYGSIPQQDHQDGSAPDEQELSRQLLIYGKICGIFYLLIILCGMTADVWVRGSLIDFSSISSTCENISQDASLFRLGILADLTMCISDAFVAVLLAAIFVYAGANPVLAISSSVFRFLQTVTIAMNLLHMLAAALLLDSRYQFADALAEGSLGTADGASIGSDIAYLFLLVHKYGYLLALIFFGLSLVLLGGMILTYGVVPQFFGIFFCLAGVGYVVDSCLYFGKADYFGEYTNILMIPAFVAEFGFTGWLLASHPHKAKT